LFLVRNDHITRSILDETGGIGGSPSPPPFKKHSDLTLRKVRRHVLQLTQRWKSANTNVRHRLKILQRAQTVIILFHVFPFFSNFNFRR
jgi:hypothetical protein